MRKPRGMTLIEIMIAVSILTILMVLAVGGWGSVGAKSAVQNGATDLHAALLNARARAAERGTDVWVIVYPYIDKKNGTDDVDKNAGAYFVVEDQDLTFIDYYKNTFVPPNAIRPASPSPNTLLEAVYLEDYPRRNARFLKSDISAGTIKAPFATMVAKGCSFCVGGKKRGAVVFSGEGTARFIDGDGNEVTSDRSQVVSVSSFNTPLENYFLVVTGPTGFVGLTF